MCREAGRKGYWEKEDTGNRRIRKQEEEIIRNSKGNKTAKGKEMEKELRTRQENGK